MLMLVVSFLILLQENHFHAYFFKHFRGQLEVVTPCRMHIVWSFGDNGVDADLNECFGTVCAREHGDYSHRVLEGNTVPRGVTDPIDLCMTDTTILLWSFPSLGGFYDFSWESIDTRCEHIERFGCQEQCAYFGIRVFTKEICLAFREVVILAGFVEPHCSYGVCDNDLSSSAYKDCSGTLDAVL